MATINVLFFLNKIAVLLMYIHFTILLISDILQLHFIFISLYNYII